MDIRVENSAEDFIAFTVIFYQRNKPNFKKWFTLLMYHVSCSNNKISCDYRILCAQILNAVKWRRKIWRHDWWSIGRIVFWANYNLAAIIFSISTLTSCWLMSNDIFEDNWHISTWWLGTLGSSHGWYPSLHF